MTPWHEQCWWLLGGKSLSNVEILVDHFRWLLETCPADRRAQVAKYLEHAAAAKLSLTSLMQLSPVGGPALEPEDGIDFKSLPPYTGQAFTAADENPQRDAEKN